MVEAAPLRLRVLSKSLIRAGSSTLPPEIFAHIVAERDTVLSGSETFGTSPDLLAAEGTGGCSCSGDNASDVSSDVAATSTACR